MTEAGHGAGIVAEIPVDERENALFLGLAEGLVPIADGAGETDGFRSPSGVRVRTGAEDEEARRMEFVSRSVPPRGECERRTARTEVGYLILNGETGSSSKVAESGTAPATIAAMPRGARKNGGTPRLQTM